MKEGKLRLASGKGGNGIPLPLPGSGAGKGTVPMNDKEGKIAKSIGGNAKELPTGPGGAFQMDPRAAKEWLKYASKPTPPSKYKPNSRVTGRRTNSPTDIQQNFTGDPSGQAVAGTPLYQQGLSGKRSLESPVNKEQIPAAYRRQVKDYFDSIGAGK